MSEIPAQQSYVPVVLAGLLFLAIGLYLARDIGRANWVAMKWTKTKAGITASYMDCVYDQEGEADCGAYIDYAYETEDNAYSAHKVKVLRGKLFSTRVSLAEELAERFQEGRPLDIYYNPANQPVSDLGPDNAPNALPPLFFCVLGLVALTNARRF